MSFLFFSPPEAAARRGLAEGITLSLHLPERPHGRRRRAELLGFFAPSQSEGQKSRDAGAHEGAQRPSATAYGAAERPYMHALHSQGRARSGLRSEKERGRATQRSETEGRASNERSESKTNGLKFLLYT